MSLTANSPSPHFKFPCSPSSHQEESNDYFTFNSTKYRVDASSQQGEQQQQQSQQQQHGLQNNYTIYEDEEENKDFPKNSQHQQGRPSPSSRKYHTKFDSLSSIKTNGSDQTLVEPYIRPRGPQSMDSTDTLLDFSNTLSSSCIRPPPKFNFTSSPLLTHTKHGFATPSSATDHTFFSKTSSSPQVTPTRPVVHHSASLSQDSSRFNTRINKDMIYQVPANSSFISHEQLTHYINSSKFDRSTGLTNLIIIDVRPFGEYCKNHIKNSINICLSSTLLKRSSFDLKRCFDSLPACDKLLFSAHLNKTNSIDTNGIPCSDKGFPAIVLYDSCTESDNKSSLSLAYTASKFIQDKDWDSPIYLLRGGYKEFSDRNSDYLSNHDEYINPTVTATTPSLQLSSSQFSNNVSMFSNPSSGSSPASSIHSISSLPLIPPRPPITTSAKQTSSPILSRFILPSPSNAVFKTRHNEEILTAKPDRALALCEASLTDFEKNKLPNWILSTIGNDSGSSSIAEKFNYLETSERDRLRKVFSTSTHDNGNDHPKISSGVELGNKNRYKDILPYEHSRVKLPGADVASCDYINASYISCDISPNRYIATQGPLHGTIGDFWSLVVSHRSPLILSLTAQNEGGVEKCAPFWEQGIYYENSNTIKVENLEQDDNFKINQNSETSMILRRLKITINDSTVHEILQIQVLSWPDYGASMSKDDLLSLVALKKSILKHSNVENSPIIVHCSAGCGRTGTFCAIDSTIDMMLSDPTSNEEDPILKTVDCFRRQRISMVQTLRQYLLIYDTVLLFLKRKLNKCDDDNWDYRVTGKNSVQKSNDFFSYTQQNNNDNNIDILIHFVNDLKLQ